MEKGWMRTFEQVKGMVVKGEGRRGKGKNARFAPLPPCQNELACDDASGLANTCPFSLLPSPFPYK